MVIYGELEASVQRGKPHRDSDLAMKIRSISSGRHRTMQIRQYPASLVGSETVSGARSFRSQGNGPVP